MHRVCYLFLTFSVLRTSEYSIINVLFITYSTGAAVKRRDVASNNCAFIHGAYMESGYFGVAYMKYD